MRQLLDHEIQFISGGEVYAWWQVPLFAGSAAFLANGALHFSQVYHSGTQLSLCMTLGLTHGLYSSLPTLAVATLFVLSIEAGTFLGIY